MPSCCQIFVLLCSLLGFARARPDLRTFFAAAREASHDFRLQTFFKRGQRKFPEDLHFDGLDWSPGLSELWLYALRNLRAGLQAWRPEGWSFWAQRLRSWEDRVTAAMEGGEKREREAWKRLWYDWRSNGLETLVVFWEQEAANASAASEDGGRRAGAPEGVDWGGAAPPAPVLQGLRSAAFALSNGVSMPALGLGTTMLNGGAGEDAVVAALGLGYRLIDTAQSYNNEKEVGRAIRRAGVDRSEVFLCTKVSNPKHFRSLPELFQRQLRDMQVDYVDLYFIHGPDDWPAGPRAAWRAMEDLYDAGKIRALGVSNFSPEQIEQLMDGARVKPHVVQNKFSVYHWGDAPNPGRRNYLAEFRRMGVVLMGYSTLDCYPFIKQPLLDEHVLAVARRVGKTAAQVLLRHALQLGVAMIPKSGNATRLLENSQVFDFDIAPADMALLDSLPLLSARSRVGYLPDVLDLFGSAPAHVEL